MKYPRYEYQTENEHHFFEFTSKGIKGSIRKIVQYTKIGDENIYNLAFGDSDNKTNEINDKIVTNNGDSIKVLATVVSTLYAFTEEYLINKDYIGFLVKRKNH